MDNLAKVKEDIKNKLTDFKTISEDLRSNKGVVLVALDVDPKNISYASGSIFSDKDVILKSLNQSELVIDLMSPKFFDDEEVMLVALQKYSGYLELASMRIYKMCINSDPIKVLSSIVEHNKLQEELKGNEIIPKKLKI